MPDIIALRYHGTNSFFIVSEKGLLAFDAGWPGTYSEYKEALKMEGFSIKDIRWLIVSHFHYDHAGLAGTLQEKGIEFFIFRNQLAAIGSMEKLITRKGLKYVPVDLCKAFPLELYSSREWLKTLGIDGEVLHTRGHGEQCISLLLDTGEAFIGDLVPEHLIDQGDLESIRDWKLLRSKRARKIYPAHANEYLLDY